MLLKWLISFCFFNYTHDVSIKRSEDLLSTDVIESIFLDFKIVFDQQKV